MTTGHAGQLDEIGVEILDRAECLRLLGSVPIGRISFTANALPAIQPVNFVVHEDHVVIRTRPGSKLDMAVRKTVVAFEADEYDRLGESGWNVTVVGTSDVVADPASIVAFNDLPLRSWAPGVREHFVTISMTIVSGRRIVNADTREMAVD